MYNKVKKPVRSVISLEAVSNLKNVYIAKILQKTESKKIALSSVEVFFLMSSALYLVKLYPMSEEEKINNNRELSIGISNI